ncbi:MAG TPA: glutathione S-transferase N-terminal domain-containing protein [Burkholderiales bacterium]|nr:glutathione S-transferase N-terminal domain-containing protein [Burkholderiales bacterium]
MKLLGHDGSPFVRKVRIALEEKRIGYDYVHARSSEPGSTLWQHNPLSKIPVLITDAGKPIYDSPVIVEYLDGVSGDPRLIPAGFEERIDVKRWEALGDGIADATVLTSHDYDKVQSAEWHRRQRLKIERGLAAMAKDLGEREFCFGERFTLADIAAGYALGYIDQVTPDIDWRKAHPNLARLAERLAQRESFRKTLPEK